METSELSDGEMPWPDSGGIWMAWIEDMQCWFPLRAMPLRDDTPTGEEIARHKLENTCHLREVLAIVVQLPRSKTEWPYVFRGNHPCVRFRRPTELELKHARHFYGLD